MTENPKGTADLERLVDVAVDRMGAALLDDRPVVALRWAAVAAALLEGLDLPGGER